MKNHDHMRVQLASIVLLRLVVERTMPPMPTLLSTLNTSSITPGVHKNVLIYVLALGTSTPRAVTAAQAPLRYEGGGRLPTVLPGRERPRLLDSTSCRKFSTLGGGRENRCS